MLGSRCIRHKFCLLCVLALGGGECVRDVRRRATLTAHQVFVERTTFAPLARLRTALAVVVHQRWILHTVTRVHLKMAQIMPI